MYRVLALFFNLIAALTVGSIFQASVNLNIDVPTEVVAGTEFEVRVKIQKGELESFSRLQQNFPAGLKASSSITSNSDFTADDKLVRMIWLRLPKEQDITVVYKIRVDERLKGSFTIKGKFSYIEENERKSVNIESFPINISPSPTVDPQLIVDINEFEEKVVPYIAPTGPNGMMACLRQAPIPDLNGESYIVNVLVNKENQQKFAKIEEAIPDGFEAVSIDSKDGMFTFKNKTAKFLWMNMPPESSFIVSYKLMAKSKKLGLPHIKGKFSFLEGEKTTSIDIKQTGRELASLAQQEILNIQASPETSELAENITSPNDKITKTHRISVENKLRIRNKPKARARNKKELKSNMPYILEPEDGVYYRVQLAAGHNSVSIAKYFDKYNLDKEVRKEFHKGWHKYSIGSFNNYKSARDYRVHIWNTTIISDAFVSAYNNGSRITVQEALMIANQKWYR